MRLWLLILSLLAGSACALDPITGRPRPVLTSEAAELAQGRRAAAAIERKLGVLEDEELARYVDAIGQRLARQSPRRGIAHRFRVVDMVEPNAFALPGGHIYVSRGLLALLNSEDELANVLAHEVGHVAARHSVEREVREAALLPARIAGVFGAMAASILSPEAGALGQVPADAALAAYSRAQELEADRVGQKIVARAGWDPAALSSVLRTLSREHELRGRDTQGLAFLASHPSGPERQAESRRNASSLPAGEDAPFAADRVAFLRRLEGTVVGVRAAGGLFLGERFLHPELHIGVAFPEDWQTLNEREAVSARSPDGRRFVILSLGGNFKDPVAAARSFEQRYGLIEPHQVLRIGALPAAHGIYVSGRRGERVYAHLTWIGHLEQVWVVMGLSPEQTRAADFRRFDAVARSFHSLTNPERDEVREDRLRFTEPRRGETLARLLARSGSVWSPEEAAVANGIEIDTKLGRGMWIKYPRREPYIAP